MIRRLLLGIVALSVALSVLGGAHFYIVRRLVLDPAWPAALQSFGVSLVVGLGALLFLAPIGERALPRRYGRWLSIAGSTWMGVGFWLLLACGASDLLRFGIGLFGGPAEGVALARVQAGGILWIVGLAVAVGAREALRGPRLVEREIRLQRWPAALDDFRIVQISDIHIGPSLGRRFAARVAERVNALAPDLVAVTGDLADGSVRHLADEARPFGKLSGRHGVFFVTGNHDHYSGAETWVGFVESLGFRPLRNERIAIEQDGAGFDLAGVDDHRGGMKGSTEDLPRALEGRDPARAVVLLAHDPSTFKRAIGHDVDLQLSGHTHGGQIWPFRYMVRLATPFVAGHYRRGASQIYVSRGTGFWGPPLRLFAPAEITLLRLRAG